MIKDRNATMEIKRLSALAIEIFKTVNNLNPDYIKDIFTPGDIKSETSYIKIKEYINTWFGPKCRCMCVNTSDSINVKCMLTLAGGLSYILMFLLMF